MLWLLFSPVCPLCSDNIFVNSSSSVVYSRAVHRQQTICINVSVPLATVVFDSVTDASVSIFWSINRKNLFARTIRSLDGIYALDFGDDIGSLAIEISSYQILSLSILAFPSYCGLKRFVSNNVHSVVGLSTSFSRSALVTNQEVMCFWMISPSNYSFRIPPFVKRHSFDLSICQSLKNCRKITSHNWEIAPRNSYFELESRIDFYSSIYSVQFRDPSMIGQWTFEAVLTGQNFTTYTETHRPGRPISEKEYEKRMKWKGAMFTFVVLAVVAIIGFIVVAWALMCEKESLATPEETEHLLK
jgi:hypothetical protein